MVIALIPFYIAYSSICNIRFGMNHNIIQTYFKYFQIFKFFFVALHILFANLNCLFQVLVDLLLFGIFRYFVFVFS